MCQTPEGGDWASRVDSLARHTLDTEGLPSVQVAVGLDGEMVFEQAYGLAEVEHQVAATPQTRYRTASISKWFTGVAAMRLMERGALDLDAPVQTYCPEFPEKQSPVTTRQLLAHTSGIRHYLNYEAMLDAQTSDEARDEVRQMRDRAVLGSYTRYTDVVTPLDNFKDDPLMFEPGSAHQYSSFGYRVLACVIEGAAGSSYRRVLGDEVFEPAGMEFTRDDDAYAIIPDRAGTYALVGQTYRRAQFRDVSENLPAGGHLSTAADLIRFAQAFNTEGLVSSETIALMASEPVYNGETVASGYGHGVDLIGWYPGSLGHNGNQAGTTTFLILIPEKALSVAVMTNASGWNRSNQFAGGVMEIVGEAFGLNLTMPTN